MFRRNLLSFYSTEESFILVLVSSMYKRTSLTSALYASVLPERRQILSCQSLKELYIEFKSYLHLPCALSQRSLFIAIGSKAFTQVFIFLCPAKQFLMVSQSFGLGPSFLNQYIRSFQKRSLDQPLQLFVTVFRSIIITCLLLYETKIIRTTRSRKNI